MKIEAKDLRLGNLVDFKGEILPIHAINGDNTISLLKNGRSIGCFRISDLKPIPITEEWLLRFGFVYKKTDKANCYSLHFFSVNFVTDGRYKGKTFIRVANFNPDVNNFLYVHQLQNLYFTLTGDELKLTNHEES